MNVSKVYKIHTKLQNVKSVECRELVMAFLDNFRFFGYIHRDIKLRENS